MTTAPVELDLLHGALRRALALYPEGAACRAADALRTIMFDRITSDGAGAWSSSRLTGDGFPVEFGFSTADNRLRYTAEPASSRIDPRDRLERAIGLLDVLDPLAVPWDVVAELRRLQSCGSLAYGAWLGARHRPDGDEYKVYVETTATDGAHDFVDSRFERFFPRLPDRRAKLRMVAYSVASGQYEAYFRVAALAPHHVPRLLSPCGLEARAGELVDYLQSAHGYSLRDKLPGASVGVSYAIDSSGSSHAITLFFFARSFWGSDARIRRCFGRLGRELHWDDTRYQALTAPYSARDSGKTCHGLIGVTVTAGRPLALSVGVRPGEADE